MPWIRIRRESGWVLEEGPSPVGVQAQEQAPQGYSPKLLEFMKCLDSTLWNKVWILGDPVWTQELDSMILVHLFQLKIF